MKIAPAVVAALAVILALVVVDTCARRSERQKLEARQRDTRDDSTVSRLVHEAAVTGQRFQRERDSTGRVIQRLRAKIAPRIIGSNLPIPPTAAYDPVLAGRDSLIASLTAGRTQDSLQILFWQSQTASRDTVIAQLQASRNAWRSRSERRPACVGGPSVTAGLNGRVAYGIGLTCGIKL